MHKTGLALLFSSLLNFKDHLGPLYILKFQFYIIFNNEKNKKKSLNVVLRTTISCRIRLFYISTRKCRSSVGPGGGDHAMFERTHFLKITSHLILLDRCLLHLVGNEYLLIQHIHMSQHCQGHVMIAEVHSKSGRG